MRVEGDGPIPCRLALVGEAPGYEEQVAGRSFVGRGGQQLWAMLDRCCGLRRRDVYTTNVLKTALPKGKSPTPADLAAAIPDLLDELAQVRPAIVVTAGAVATAVFLGHRPFTDVHGIPHAAEVMGSSYVVHPIYHPMAGLGNKGLLAPFVWDLQQLAALRRGERQPWAPSPQGGQVSWLLEAPRGRHGLLQGRVWALDTEGWADAPWGLSVTADGQTAYVVPATATAALAWLTRQLPGRTVVLHNGLHDLAVLRALGVTVPDGWHDTQVLAYHDLLQTGSGALEASAQNLGTLAYRECGLTLQELTDQPGVDFDTRTIPVTDAVRDYAGWDALAAWRLFQVYAARGYLEYTPYQIDMGQIGLIEAMQRTGLPFDQEGVLAYYTDVLDRLDEAGTALRAKAQRFGLRAFNPGSPVQVRELLTRKVGLSIRKRTKSGLASTNEKALADHRDHPLVQQLQAYRELVKVKGTYVEPLLEALT